MDKIDFGKIIKELNIVYGEKKFPLTKDVMEIWHKYLGGFSYEDVSTVIEMHVKSSAFPPAISEVISGISELRKKAMDKTVELETIYRSILENYPSARDEIDVRKAYVDITGYDIGKSRELLKRVRQTVHLWEDVGEPNIPELSDFLRGIII